ncbi:hypothetical protein BDW42DRAFT_195630 [Aspergillus taichungensis]|uniref:hydroxyisourate hydrolase n=1 Tax=Aspergillus taichungensis TaxID=482145 RepID=A0A2J5HNM2_9EURO|nr:hypothetical protein BDW42DRAFT_195630 [Aspergillus taichungensis]
MDSSKSLRTATDRLSRYQNWIIPPPSRASTSTPASSSATTQPPTMSRDPITCHVLNTLTGTPAANLPVTLTRFVPSSASTSTTPTPTTTYHATTNADGRVAHWTPASGTEETASVAAVLAALPADAEPVTHWAVRFDVGPWYAAQGVESFWPDVEVRFTVRGRGVEGQDGWRHYHVPVLLGPWNYSTYRGS